MADTDRISDIEDELHVARNFVECAYMATGHLNDELSKPLSAVLNAASEKLEAVLEALANMKAGLIGGRA